MGFASNTLGFSLRSANFQRIFFPLERNQLLNHVGVHASVAASGVSDRAHGLVPRATAVFLGDLDQAIQRPVAAPKITDNT